MTDGMGRQSWWPSAAARVGDTKARPATARAARGRRHDRARAGWLRPRDAARIRELQDVEVARLDDASLEQDGDDEATNGRGLEELHENAEDRRHLDAVVIKDSAPVALRQRGTLQVNAWEVSGSRADMNRQYGGQTRCGQDWRAHGEPEAQGSAGGKRAGRTGPLDVPQTSKRWIQREAGIHSAVVKI